jgi:hypothetical protein
MSLGAGASHRKEIVPLERYIYDFAMTEQPLPPEPSEPLNNLAPPTTPAGWYPTPSGAQRYWDGSHWTDLPPDEADHAHVPEVATAHRLSRRALYLAAGGFLVVLAIVVIVVISTLPKGSSTPKAVTTFTARGSFVLTDSPTDGGQVCAPTDGYSDISAGAQVIVSDSSGKTLAIGSLQNPTAGSGTCSYSFAVHNVPVGKKFYGVEVSHRGSVKESENDMTSGSVALSLGN